MTGPVLATEHLAKRFGGVVATDDVSLSVEPGELLCIIGPNGAGKSTFFSLLCGIQQPYAGRILFKGEDITHLPSFARVRQGIGLTFQTNRSFVELDVSQNLAIPMAAMRTARGGEAEERYRYALDLFGLAEDDPTPVRELAHDRRGRNQRAAKGLHVVRIVRTVCLVYGERDRVGNLVWNRMDRDVDSQTPQCVEQLSIKLRDRNRAEVDGTHPALARDDRERVAEEVEVDLKGSAAVRDRRRRQTAWSHV